MDRGAAAKLADSLNELMLPRNRALLCAPAIELAPDLEPQAYFVLSTLARTGPLSTTRLAERVGIDRSGTSRYADRLREAGLLDRELDPADGRASLLALTPAGERLAERLSAALTTYLGELTAGWKPDQGQALLDGIARLLGELEEVEPDLAAGGVSESA